jgi:hypothetical protein
MRAKRNWLNEVRSFISRSASKSSYIFSPACMPTELDRNLASAGPKFQIRVDAEMLKRSDVSGAGLAFIAGRILTFGHVKMTA